MKKFLLLFLILNAQNSLGFSTEISGKVISETTRVPIAGAIVMVKEIQYTVTTNESGFFSIPIQAQEDITLTVSFVGFDKLERRIKIDSPQKSSLIILLKKAEIKLEEIVVTSDRSSAAQTLSGIDINLRPLMNSQELLRTVPGLFIGQHAGGGKAEQIFLRGFDIDHGTDIRLTVDGMPVNMVSHAHGQGYSDLHFVIPELMDRISFGKGPYEADQGNFSTAGWVDFRTKDVLEQSTIKAEIGQFNTYRLFTAVDLLGKTRLEKGHSAYIASEYNYSDSYFDSPQHFNRFNAIAKYHARLKKGIFKASMSTFWSKWNHSGQIPERAVNTGEISFYGAIDDTEGGVTSRTNAQLQWWLPLKNGLFSQQAFYTHYGFELFSNFTFFLEDPVHGDQIKQWENRNLYGYTASYLKEGLIGKLLIKTRAGLSYRHDFTEDSELSHTENKSRVITPMMLGDINEANLGIYLEEELRLSRRISARIGLRYDLFWNQYKDLVSPHDGGRTNSGIILPKFSLFYTANSNFQLYLKAGKSFHSNDTRVVVPQKGKRVLPPAYGSDLGINWKPFPKLFVNAAVWYLWLDQEFVYVGDAGIVEPSGQTRRSGFDLSLRYQLTKRLYADLDFNAAVPRALGTPEGVHFIPLAPLFTSAGGVTYKALKRLSGSLRYRYMGKRPATEDNAIVANGYFLTELQVNYSRPRYSFGLSVNNLMNRRWKETQFATNSRLKNESNPVEEIHFTAGSPLFARLSVTYNW